MFGIDEPGIAKRKEAGLPTAAADEIARDRCRDWSGAAAFRDQTKSDKKCHRIKE